MALDILTSPADARLTPVPPRHAAAFCFALLVTAWIEVAMLVVQIPQILVSIALPAIGGILSLLSFALYFVLAVQLIRAVHGFRNPLLVALGIVGTVFVAGFALSLLAASLGIMPEVFA